MAHWRPSILEDAAALAPRLRVADQQEIKAGTGFDPLTGLLHCWFASQPCCNTIVGEDGRPIGMFGYTVGPSPIEAGVWMLAADDLVKHRIQFIRESRAWLSSLNEQYPLLHNKVDARNGHHIRWLKSMGFTFIRTFDYGIEGLPFHEFVRITPNV